MDFEEILDMIDNGHIEDLDQSELLEALLVMRNFISNEVRQEQDYDQV